MDVTRTPPDGTEPHLAEREDLGSAQTGTDPQPTVGAVSSTEALIESSALTEDGCAHWFG